MILRSSVYCWQGQRPSWLCTHCKPGKETWYVCRETKQKNVSWLISMLEIVNGLGLYICRDVVEFGNEGMFDNIHSDFRDDDHDNIRKQTPHVVCSKTKTKTKKNTLIPTDVNLHFVLYIVWKSLESLFFFSLISADKPHLSSPVSLFFRLTGRADFSEGCHSLCSHSTHLWWDRPQRYCSKITKSKRKKKKELLSRFLFWCLQWQH